MNKPYVAHISFDIGFSGNPKDPYEDFEERYRDLVEFVCKNYGIIEITEDEMESDE